MTTIQEFNQIDGRISSLYHAAALKMGLSDSEFRILYTLAVNEPGYLQSALRDHGYGPLYRQFRFEEAGAGGHTDPVPRQWTAHLCLPDGTGASSGR